MSAENYQSSFAEKLNKMSIRDWLNGHINTAVETNTLKSNPIAQQAKTLRDNIDVFEMTHKGESWLTQPDLVKAARDFIVSSYDRAIKNAYIPNSSDIESGVTTSVPDKDKRDFFESRKKALLDQLPSGEGGDQLSSS